MTRQEVANETRHRIHKVEVQLEVLKRFGFDWLIQEQWETEALVEVARRLAANPFLFGEGWLCHTLDAAKKLLKRLQTEEKRYFVSFSVAEAIMVRIRELPADEYQQKALAAFRDWDNIRSFKTSLEDLEEAYYACLDALKAAEVVSNQANAA